MNTQYSIVGSGPVGRTLAGLFARAGIDVQIANSRRPESLAGVARHLGQHVIPVTLERALAADVIFLAVGFMQVPSVAVKRTTRQADSGRWSSYPAMTPMPAPQLPRLPSNLALLR